MLLLVGGLILSEGELGAIDDFPVHIARRILMTLFDEIAWLVREDKMDCHGQAWDVKICGACPADAKDLEQHFCAGKGAQSAGPHPIGLACACAGLRAHATT